MCVSRTREKIVFRILTHPNAKEPPEGALIANAGVLLDDANSFIVKFSFTIYFVIAFMRIFA